MCSGFDIFTVPESFVSSARVAYAQSRGNTLLFRHDYGILLASENSPVAFRLRQLLAEKPYPLSAQ